VLSGREGCEDGHRRQKSEWESMILWFSLQVEQGFKAIQPFFVYLIFLSSSRLVLPHALSSLSSLFSLCSYSSSSSCSSSSSYISMLALLNTSAVFHNPSVGPSAGNTLRRAEQSSLSTTSTTKDDEYEGNTRRREENGSTDDRIPPHVMDDGYRRRCEQQVISKHNGR